MKTTRSSELFSRARRRLPGGVNSPARSWGSVGGEPLFFARGQGAHVWDADGNELIDYVCSWGPLILGHAHPAVVKAVTEAAGLGTSYGAPTEAEVQMAELVCSAMPSLEMVRFVNSGTEATMSALRLARAATGRHRIVKFEGAYHGHEDALLVKAGSGLATHGVPTSAGIHPGYAADTLVAPYNDLTAVEKLFRDNPKEIAAVIVEPIAGNMGVVLPVAGYLEGLRAVTRKHGALLIFDEVISGFRLGLGGAQAAYRVMPDITTLGKIIGGGLPVGAYGGSAEVMSRVAPLGPMYQAGTLSGNPLAMAAGLATLRELQKPGTYERLEAKGSRLETGLRKTLARRQVPATITRAGSLLTLFFNPGPVTGWDSASRSDTRAFSKLFHALARSGVYIPPSQYEAWFLSLAHSEADIDATIAAVDRALAA
ncbi:MAG: glutamate-1-semialdehyde-2,1-aminomutase [SAR202 cluster bacterium]|nr:glutamate-1-semialdehyde-2,1-aminomutase [SAR202 cluster bacterium]